jgi:hypothetical protein
MFSLEIYKGTPSVQAGPEASSCDYGKQAHDEKQVPPAIVSSRLQGYECESHPFLIIKSSEALDNHVIGLADIAKSVY